MTKRGWSPGDLDYPAAVKKNPKGGGATVYITGEHLAKALTGKWDGPVPDVLTVVRTVLDPGTGQVLLRFRAPQGRKA